MDQSCPNAPFHRLNHISHADFLRLLHTQLTHDRGHDADSTPLHRTGAVGSLFKVRLSTYGYTLVAKGVESANCGRLRHEEKIYKQLSAIQGRHIPVCIGLIDLELPYYYDGGVFEHFLLFSWAGRPLSNRINLIDEVVAVNAITRTYTELHRLGVCHRDAELRNVLYDQSLMVVDFERAEFLGHQPLGPLSPNGPSRKRKWGLPHKQSKDPFTQELQLVVEDLLGCFGRR